MAPPAEPPSASYDVVIVGAGPAGLNCARKLDGRSVLVLEQKPGIGPKVCAGGLTTRSIAYLKLPEALVERRFDRVYLHSPRRTAEVRCPLATIDRARLGAWMQEGLPVRTGARVTGVERDHVVVNGVERIGFRYLVGADGARSVVRRSLGLPSERVIHAVQYLVPADGHTRLEAFFDARLFGSGYAWIFPHDGYVSVGCRYDSRCLGVRHIREGFHAWLRRHGFDVARAEYQAHTINCDFRGYRFGHVLLAGDAAGTASFLTGEGIYQALISGEEAANVIATGRSGLLDEVLRGDRLHVLIQDALDAAGPLRPTLLELGIRLLQNRHLGTRMLGA